MAKMGRPTLFNQKMADYICMRVATNTEGLQRLVDKFDDLPAKITINEWRFRYPDFAAQYTVAKQCQAELLAEETLDIADDNTADYLVDEEGVPRLSSDHVQRARLRVDTRKWLASKLAPKIYGERTHTEAIVTVKHEDALKDLK